MVREASVERCDRAKLLRRGTGSLQERWFAEGTVKQMIDRYFKEHAGKRRELVLMTAELQYKPAEIQGLAERLTGEAEASVGLTRQPHRVKGMRY